MNDPIITVDCCDCGARHTVAASGWTALRCQGCGRTIERADDTAERYRDLLATARLVLIDCTTPDGQPRAPRPGIVKMLRAAIRNCEEVDR